MLRTLRRPFEYLAARLALAIVPRLSRPRLLAVAQFLGSVSYAFLGRLKLVALANLRVALPNLSPDEQKACVKKSLGSFALAMLDTFWLSRDTTNRLTSLVRFDPSFAALAFKPGPLICITAHMGNWEVMGLAVAQQGYPLTSVTAPIKNPWLDPLFNRLRNTTGQRTVPKKGAVRTLLKTLRDGGKIALVMDQNVKPAHGGLFVDFFGLPTPFSSAAALLSLRTGAPIGVGVCLADPAGGYATPPAIEIDQTALPGDEQEAIKELTQRIARALEQLIRAHPEHWLWTYKRWKMRPVEADPAAYPFYTRAVRPADLPAAGRDKGTEAQGHKG